MFWQKKIDIFVVLPQLAMSLIGPFLISIFWNNLVACFVAGSISCFVSAVLMIFLDSDKKIEKRRLKLVEQRTKKLIAEGKIKTEDSIINANKVQPNGKKEMVGQMFTEQDTTNVGEVPYNQWMWTSIIQKSAQKTDHWIFNFVFFLGVEQLWFFFWNFFWIFRTDSNII